MKMYHNFTKTERIISDYILSHIDEVIHDTAITLADKTETSASAIIRFSKILGYSGFTDLKIELALDANQIVEESLFSEKIENNDSLDTIIKKAKSSDSNIVNQTYALIDYEKLDAAIEALRKAKSIYLVGIGSSYICCLDLTYKLLRIHMHAVHHTDFDLLMTTMAYISSDDVVIGISYGGETIEVITALELAKEKGVTTIGITQLSKNTVHKLVDISLHVPTTERDLRLGAVTSRNASLIITDLLYLGLIRKDLDMYKEKLMASRQVIKQYKTRR